MKQLCRVLRKMKLSVDSHSESTALITHREQSDVFLWSHTGKEVAVRTGRTQDVCGHDRKLWSQMNWCRLCQQ